MKNPTAVLLYLVVAVAAAGSAYADTIPAQNFSFQESLTGFGHPVSWTQFTPSTSSAFSSDDQIIPSDDSALFPEGADSQLGVLQFTHSGTSAIKPDPVVPVSGRNSLFENVRLPSLTAIPEPGSRMLFCVGALALLLVRFYSLRKSC